MPRHRRDTAGTLGSSTPRSAAPRASTPPRPASDRPGSPGRFGSTAQELDHLVDVYGKAHVVLVRMADHLDEKILLLDREEGRLRAIHLLDERPVELCEVVPLPHLDHVLGADE